MLTNFWKNLSVSKKLYSVVGLMALLILTELLTLLFAMNTLSAVRSLVHGEGMWSKAQKDAVQSLQKYVVTGDEIFFQQFHEHVQVPQGDRQARLEMEKENPDYKVIHEGFVQGKIHPDDVEPIVKLLTRFHEVTYLKNAISYWRQGDDLMDELMNMGLHINNQFKLNHGLNVQERDKILADITDLNARFTVIEDGFSTTLGNASRWLENLLMIGLVLAVIMIEGFGLFLTISFTGGLSQTLKELTGASHKIGAGDFSVRVPVHSKDELGQLAESINAMALNLQNEASQRQHAEQASYTKNLFLANMSHEIRTPLNAILGFTDLLRDPQLSSKERNQYLDIVKRTGISLASIINDILDVTKIEADQMRVEKVRFSLPLLLKDVESVMKLRSDEKGLGFSIHQIGEIAEFIVSDPIRLRQILTNIIGNAIKYTDRGSVELSVQTARGLLMFDVEDTGRGIDDKDRSKLFIPFSQGDISSQKKYGGTGLGLILSKKLAHLLGGDVTLVKSAPNKGSLFNISIHYQPARETAEDISNITPVPQRTEGYLDGKRVLVVEDTVDSQLLLKLYLAKKGVQVDVASNGEEGVQKALNEKYDLVLMDMQMPIMDGYTATKVLRGKGYKVPIVALTAYAMQGDRDKTISAGCTDYLTKPVDKEKLIAIVEQYTN